MKPTNDNGAHSFTEVATFETAENINEFLKEEKNMEAIRLISMTDFVLEIDKEWENPSKPFSENKALMKICKYATFLKQPLQLGFFVPCFETGEIFNKPFGFDSYIEHRELSIKIFTTGEIERCKLYEKAKKRVLFKGFFYKFNIDKDGKKWEYVKNELPHVFSIDQLKRITIEGLLTGFKEEYLIELTDSAIKQIGL